MAKLEFGEQINLNDLNSNLEEIPANDCDYIFELGGMTKSGARGVCQVFRGKRGKKDEIEDHSLLYLGCLSPKEVENETKKKSLSFGLYHKTTGDMTLFLTLILHIFYKTPHGSINHLPVETKFSKSGTPLFCLGGISNPPMFSTLEHLIHFYKTFVICSTNGIPILPQ